MKCGAIALLLAWPMALLAGHQARLDGLHWLAGCWAFEGTSSRYEEVWLRPAADQLIGLSRRIGPDGRTREFEYLRIVPSGVGLDYVAQPSGDPPVRFHLHSIDGRRAVFSNLQHDFPQTITYEFSPPGQLLARIEGPAGDTRKSIDFPMQRQPCESAP